MLIKMADTPYETIFLGGAISRSLILLTKSSLFLIVKPFLLVRRLSMVANYLLGLRGESFLWLFNRP